jgi:membrane associated rhomboid family serine protease
MKRTLFFQRPFPVTFYNATIILLVINVVIFLLRYVAPNFQEAYINLGENLSGNGQNYFALVPDLVMNFQRPWTVITYMFVHGNELHIIFNMLALVIFGTVIEHKLGSLEFLLYYFVTGILSGILIAVVYPLIGLGDAQVVGASAAIYALLLAYAVFFPYNTLLIWGIIPVKAYILVIGLTAFAIVGSIFNIMGNVADLGHLGGILFGLLYFPGRLRINPLKEIIYTRRYYQ